VRVTASDLYSYYCPSECPGRVWLRERGEPEGEPSPYQEVLLMLGKRHEESHLASLPTPTDLSSVPREERPTRTIEAVRERASVVYQGALRVGHTVAGVACEVLGEPDFLVREGNGYLIRDSKIARRVNEKDHLEILLQMGLYGWLYERTFGQPPVGLQVHSGTGDVVPLPYDGGGYALTRLGDILALKRASAEPFSPCGWSKCSGCGFFHRCWHRAEACRDVALIPDADQGLVAALRDKGVVAIEELLDRFNEEGLAAFQRPYGGRMQKVGKKAGAILAQAKALSTGKETLLASPDIPAHVNYVMFDLESLPPQLDEAEKIYLWGLQVFGSEPSQYWAATAGFGQQGDRQGWERFLLNADAIFQHYGSVPFVHWAPYEKTRTKSYIARYGDPAGVAARVLDNLLDLHAQTKASIVLPPAELQPEGPREVHRLPADLDGGRRGLGHGQVHRSHRDGR